MSKRKSNETSSASEQRTISGIVVHLIGMVLGLFGVIVVYLLSNSEFTRINAKNALNWHLTVTIALLIGLVLAFGLGALVADWFVLLGALIIIIFGLLNILFCLWATVKALDGNQWKYPIAPSII